MSPDEENRQTLTEQQPEPKLEDASLALMTKLEAKNEQLKGRLFVAFGTGEAKTFVFDTPSRVEVQIGDDKKVEMDAFLAITTQGPKLIQELPEYSQQLKEMLDERRKLLGEGRTGDLNPQYSRGHLLERDGAEMIFLNNIDISPSGGKNSQFPTPRKGFLGDIYLSSMSLQLKI